MLIVIYESTVLENVGSLMSHNSTGLHGLLQGYLLLQKIEHSELLGFWVQWLGLAPSEGPNWAGVSSLTLRWTKSRNPVILSVVHHHHNPLDTSRWSMHNAEITVLLWNCWCHCWAVACSPTPTAITCCSIEMTIWVVSATLKTNTRSWVQYGLDWAVLQGSSGFMVES
jgi:hypothetical protein